MVERHRISRSRKIVILSECFGVSTDYLREDYIKEPDEVNLPPQQAAILAAAPRPGSPGRGSTQHQNHQLVTFSVMVWQQAIIANIIVLINAPR